MAAHATKAADQKRFAADAMRLLQRQQTADAKGPTPLLFVSHKEK